MIKFRKITYLFSGILVLASITAIALWGFNLGIDFTGGSLLEVEFLGVRPRIEEIKNALQNFDIGEIKIQPAGEKEFIIRFKDIDEPTHQQILTSLGNIGLAAPNESQFSTSTATSTEIFSNIKEKRFDSIGPTIGKELQKRALIAIVAVIGMIIFYIAWAFRKVSKPVSSWKYGVVAIIALLHDVLIPTGIFSILGNFKGVEIDALFATALLTILGFSVHDTIVVFDRTRENLKRHVGATFEETVDTSVKEVFVRSINTSFTILLVLFALFIFGGESTRFFSLALIIGIFLGTYSSIFLASPILVSWNNFSQKRKK
jgi:preprotein translocase subunit SecF